MSTDNDDLVGQRLTALEERANEADRKTAIDERLADSVDRLSGETASLHTVLRKVDDQQRHLSRLDEAVDEKASKGAVIDVVRENKRERRRQLKRVYILVGLGLLIALSASVGGAWLTDKHLQDCVLHGPDSAMEERFCGITFPGHEHPPEISLEGLLARSLENQINAVRATRMGCERAQQRVKIEIDKERRLAEVDTEAARTAHASAAVALEATLIDCTTQYPLPGPNNPMLKDGD